MSPIPKDPNGNKGTDLTRDPRTPTQSPTEDKQKATLPESNLDGDYIHDSDGITSDPSKLQSLFDIAADSPLGAHQNCPMSEIERGHRDTLASSRGMISSSTLNGPGEGETRDAPKVPPSGSPETTLRDVEGSSNGETSSNASTGSTVTDSDVPEEHESRRPSTTSAKVKATTRKAPYARQAGNTFYRAILYCGGIFGLAVLALMLYRATGYESPSVGHLKFGNLVSQAGAGITSTYTWTQRTMQQLHQRLPTPQSSPRHSSGEQLGAGLAHIHTNLSQALAAGDALFPAPKLISARRAEAMRFQLPEGSLTSEPLLLFLQQSMCIDEDLLRLILSLGQLSGLALRQHQITTDTVRSIQLVEYFGTYQALQVRVLGVSTQESQLQARLADHFYLLNEMITSADQAAREVLQQYIVLTSTTNAIRQSSLQDRQRLLLIKEETASQWNWLTRASIHMFKLAEPEDLAKISQNLDLAQSIHEWAEGVVDILQRVTLHIKYAKINIGSLMETLNKYGTVTWDVQDKDRKLQEFLAQISEGQELLSSNRAGWLQLQYGGYI